MKFDTQIHYRKVRHRKHWLLGVRLTPLADTFSFFMKKDFYPPVVSTYKTVLMTWFLTLTVVIQLVLS